MPPKHDAGTATRHYRAFWQRRCRAAATEAVLKPLGGNCAVLPKHYKIKAFRDSVTRSVKIYGLYILIYIIHSQISRNSCHALYSFFEPRHTRRSTFIIHYSLFFIYSFNASLLTPNSQLLSFFCCQTRQNMHRILVLVYTFFGLQNRL